MKNKQNRGTVIPRPVGMNQVYKFIRTAILSQPVYDYTAPTNFAGNGVVGYFQLGQAPGSSEFTALYDVFRISGIKMTFIYGANVQASSATLTMPNLVAVNDTMARFLLD